MLGLDPSFSSIAYADATPVGHTLIDDIYTGTLVEYKLIGTGLGRRLLDVHGRRDDDGTLAVVKRLLLLIGKEIAQQEDEEETDTAKEADLAHQDVRTEKIEQHEQQRHSKPFLQAVF